MKKFILSVLIFLSFMLPALAVQPTAVLSLTGIVDPTVTPINASKGILFFKTTAPIGIFQKNDFGTSTNWSQIAGGANTISGSATNFAGFDPLGVLSYVPSWTFSPDGSANVALDAANTNGPLSTQTSIDVGVTDDHFDNFYNFFANNGTITNDVRMIQFDVNGTAGRNFSAYGVNQNLNTTGNSFLETLYQSGNTGGDFRTIDGNNTGSVSGNLAFFNTFNNGPVTQDLAFSQAGNSSTVGGNLHAINYSNNGDVAGQVQGLSFFNASNVGSDVFLVNVGNNSGAFTVAGGVFGINAYNNVNNDHVQLVNVNDNSASTTYKNGLDIDLAGSAPSYQGININLHGSSPSVQGMNINLNDIASPIQKTGLNINDGTFSVDSNWDTAILGNPGGEFQLNDVGGEFHISPGHPITDGSFGFGNNLGITVLAEDDMPVDSSGVDLGFSINGFVDQIGVVAGKTLHTLNYMSAGGGIAPESTGGSIINLSMFRALGLLPEGGTLAITNMFGFKGDALMDSVGATNLWGVYIAATTADNWFKKDVVIGGSTGKQTGSDQLDVTGSAVITQGVRLNTSGTQPTCAVDLRGTLWVIFGGTGVADIKQICLKNSSNTYAWVTY